MNNKKAKAIRKAVKSVIADEQEAKSTTRRMKKNYNKIPKQFKNKIKIQVHA